MASVSRSPERRRWLAAAVALLLAGGCSSTSSDDATTGEITASMRAIAGDAGTRVYVSLEAGFADEVILTDDDVLVAQIGDEEVELEKENFLGFEGYGGMLDVSDPGAEVLVRFERASGQDASSRVTLPAAVEVVSPASRTSFSRRAEIAVDVDDGDGTFEVSWTGPCVATPVNTELVVDPVPASGPEIVLAPGTMRRPPKEKGRPAPTSRCDVEMTITRITEGAVDGAFEGGGFAAERATTLTITLTR